MDKRTANVLIKNKQKGRRDLELKVGCHIALTNPA